MTNLLLDEKPGSLPLGAQEPRLSHVPDYVSSTGGEAVELCEMAGLYLDGWQKLVLTHMLGERADGKWAAFEVGITVPRQNGKGGILEARELTGLFLLGERLITHSAHEFATSKEAFRRLEFLIQNTPSLDRRVKRYSHSHGEEGIELKDGRRVLFKTRTKGAGRGFTADCLIYDEDMVIPESHHGATLPTLSARPNPQVIYTGSAVDQAVHEHGIVKARIRERAITGDDPSLAYFEWSPDLADPGEVSLEMSLDPEVWAESNPALGIRVSHEHVSREQRAMGPREFAVERLNVGDWPDPDGESVSLIPDWMTEPLLDRESEIDRSLELALDVSPDRSSAAIGAAGRRKDRHYHVEVVDHRQGTGWLVDRAVEVVEKQRARGIVVDERGPAAAFIPALKERRVKVYTVNGQGYAQACGRFFDCAGVGEDEPTMHHRGDPSLAEAVRGAAQRPLGDAWAWSRKNSSVDITPLVACTLALHRAARPERSGKVMA